MNSYTFSDHHHQFYSGLFNPVSSPPPPPPQSLILDSKRGELVKAPASARVGKKGISEAKALAALKNHSEAERRRRERINSHLSTLRNLVPCNDKMDKATLLAEVISQVKELKKKAAEASKGLLIPMDTDTVHVENYNNNNNNDNSARSFFKASMCCGYRPELMSDIRQALESVPVKMVRTEVSTLGDRLELVLVFTCNDETEEDFANSVKEVLSSVLDKASALGEYSPRITLPTKRRRCSYLDSSSSSS